MKKILALIISAICLFSTSCKPESQWSEETPDYGEKSVLYVMSYDGGFGYKWLEPAAKRFEEKYKGYHFEEGKTGVTIEITPMLSGTATLQDTLLDAVDEVFFTEKFIMKRYLDANSILPITDIVTEKLTEYGETRSIEDKMEQRARDFYGYGGTYYAVPHYEAFNGMAYNVEIFDKKLAWFAKDGGFVTSLTDERSAGPDGDFSTTYDNGLPATYDEFFQLCARLESTAIDKSKVSAINWSGQSSYYVTRLLASLWADFEGVSNMEVYLDFEGELSSIVESVSANGTINYAKKTNINLTNGYLAQTMEGKYHALSFLERIIKGGYYTEGAFDELQSHTLAQANYIASGYDDGEDSAIHIDGNWWFNEAKKSGSFDEMNEYYGVNADTMKFAWMPLPKANASKVGKSTLMDINWSAGFIRANIDPAKIELAKKFLQFCNTDESLREYTVTTGTTKGLDYSLTDADLAKMSYYGKSLYQHVENSNVIKAISDNLIFVNNQEGFFFGDDVFQTKIGNAPYNVPTKAMKNNGITAIDYFNGVSNFYTKTSWISSYSSYFNA